MTCIMIFAVFASPPLILVESSCWVLMLILFLFTPQGISSQGLRAWTAYDFSIYDETQPQSGFQVFKAPLFNRLPKWYVYSTFT